MHAVLEAVMRRVARELHPLSIEAAQARPLDSPHQWNSQEVVEHLGLSCRVTTQSLEERFLKGRAANARKHSPLQWMLRLMVLSFGYMPSGMPALEETVPAAGRFRQMDGEDLGDLLRRELETMDLALSRCRERYGMERLGAHPILGPLRVDQWRRFHAVHVRHHLKQLVRLRLGNESRIFSPASQTVGLAKELQIPAQRSLT